MRMRVGGRGGVGGRASACVSVCVRRLIAYVYEKDNELVCVFPPENIHFNFRKISPNFIKLGMSLEHTSPLFFYYTFNGKLQTQKLIPF
jgi:hypothetical protein